ncbi:MAG: protein kinase [Deltaproteobacteria bacterium]|nr:protein kinase [Deltaproteobacteria bacterium]
MALDLPCRLGPFELLRHLASGGMGDVYLAHGDGGASERLCVVKTVRPELATDKVSLRRFVDEARTSALLSHDNVVTVLDVGEATGTAYIAVEYVLGRDLMAVMARASRLRRPIPEPVALFIVAELLDALDYVHGACHPRTGEPLHVVHRDVSPHNLLIGFDGAVKLIDFGIARSTVRDERTQAGQLIGKVRYMSPEQARGEAVDGATDVWAACVVACELLTGRRFWGARTPEAVAPMLAAGIPHEPPAFSSLAPELQRLLARGLEQDHTRRPRAGELRDGLRAVQERHHRVGSRAETAALLEVLFAGELEGERAAHDQVLREPTMASAAAWPEHTAFEEHSELDDDLGTASRSESATRSLTPAAPLEQTRRARSARGVAPSGERRRPPLVGVVAAAATGVALAAGLAGLAAARLTRAPEERRPQVVEVAPLPPLAVEPVVAPVAAAPPVTPPPAEPPPVTPLPATVPPVTAPTVARPPEEQPPATPPAVDRRPPRRTPKATAIPLLFSDRVDALRACSPRPACAASVLRRADLVAELDVEELRDLDDALLRCLSRCAH